MSDHPVERHDVTRELGPQYPVGTEFAPFDGPAPLGESEESSGGGMARYLAAALRYKWLILLVTFLGGVAGVLVARSIPNEYNAQATLWIESPPRQQNAVQPIRSPEVLEAQGWVALLRSNAVLDSVVVQERLYLTARDPGARLATSTLVAREGFEPGPYRLTIDEAGTSFTLTRGEETVIQRGRIGDSIGHEIGLDWVPPAGSLRPSQVIEFYLSDVRVAAQSLATRLITGGGSNQRDLTFLPIALVGTDPQKTARTVNAVADRFVEVAAELRRARLEELSSVLGEQLEVAHAGLLSAEAALRDFQVSTITLPSGVAGAAASAAAGPQAGATEFFQMRLNREQIQRDRQTITRVLREAQSGPLSVFALEAVPSVARAPALQSALAELTTRRAEMRILLQRYTSEMPEVMRQQEIIDELEDQTIPMLAMALMDELITQEAGLAEQLTTASVELQQIPPRVIEEARLQRNVENAVRLYTLLQGRYEEARLAAVSSSPDVRQLETASVPRWPTNGGARTQMMLMMVLGSFGLAVAGAILLDRFDPKVRYPDQITDGMGLAILGAVPFISATKASSSPAESSHAIEAFREIRLNLAYSARERGPLVFAVTSAEAGDGKSFVSSNLALSFAQQGHRTLLIDGDIRRGRLHHFIKGVRSPGLSDLLSQRATLQEVVQTTEVPLVSLIGSGTRMHVGPELLGSAAMRDCLAELRRQYDVVIVDTPPLGAGVDPYVLGTLTGNLVMVVRTGNTNRAFAEAKLRLMDRLPIRILGAVLNGIPADQRAYRYYSYLPNYGATEETASDPAGRRLVAVGDNARR